MHIPLVIFSDNISLQTYAVHLLVLTHIACDILTITGVSILVEQLFSSSKHTLSDAWSSLSAESASKTVVSKEWLKNGFGEGLDYLDNVHTHTKYNNIMIKYQYIPITIQYHYLMNTIWSMAGSIEYKYNIIWQKNNIIMIGQP